VQRETVAETHSAKECAEAGQQGETQWNDGYEEENFKAAVLVTSQRSRISSANRVLCRQQVLAQGLVSQLASIAEIARTRLATAS